MEVGFTTAHQALFACVRVSMHALGEALVGRCRGCHGKAQAHRRPASAAEELFFLLLLQTNPDTMYSLETGHHISCRDGEKLALGGEVERER